MRREGGTGRRPGTVAGAVVAAAVVLAGVAAARPHGVPPPLHGVPLVGKTNLTLVVAAARPFLFDVDTGAVTRIRGLAAGARPIVSVSAVGGAALLWVDRRGRSGPGAALYVVRRGSAVARHLANGRDVAPASGGRAVWVKSSVGSRRCALRQLSLAGRVLRARAVPCSARLVDAGSRPVLVEGSSLVDPATGKTLLRSGGVWAIAGRYALTSSEPGRPLTVTDIEMGRRRHIAWVAIPGLDGADQAVVAPRGGRIAVDFASPAFQGSGVQVTDAWLVDPAQATMHRLPGMPAQVALKQTSMGWTRDGRLVWLASSGGRDVVAVWRPGTKRLALRRVRLPVRDGGSDSFVAWVR